MGERRRFRRFSVDIMDMNGRMVLATYVKILDISLGGVSFKADRRLNIGGEYSLKIEGKGMELTVKGIVVRSSLSESTKDSRGNVVPIYMAGMQFTDVAVEKLKEVAEFIKSNLREADKKVDLFSPSGRRLYVRVYLETAEKSLLKFYESYKIKNLSLGGMLIETECALEIEITLPLQIFLTEDKSIALTGRIISCVRTAEREHERYNVGIEFLDIPEKDRETLQEFIRVLADLNKEGGSS
jgi:hypothetical protein